jgi:hypothetical protein
MHVERRIKDGDPSEITDLGFSYFYFSCKNHQETA